MWESGNCNQKSTILERVPVHAFLVKCLIKRVVNPSVAFTHSYENWSLVY